MGKMFMYTPISIKVASDKNDAWSMGATIIEIGVYI